MSERHLAKHFTTIKIMRKDWRVWGYHRVFRSRNSKTDIQLNGQIKSLIGETMI